MSGGEAALVGQWSLRPERPEDEGFCLGLFASTRAAELALLAGPPSLRETFVRLQYQAQKRGHESAHPGAERSIVVIDGAAAGRLVVDRSGEVIRLVDIALLPEQRGRGTGAALINALLHEAGAAARAVDLHVLRGSPAARLYARIGFVRTGGTDVHDAMRWR